MTPDACPLHGYTERSARAKLERHRLRGDDSVSAYFHQCGEWHFTDIHDQAIAAVRSVPMTELAYVLGVLAWTDPEAVLAAIDTWRNDPDTGSSCSDSAPGREVAS